MGGSVFNYEKRRRFESCITLLTFFFASRLFSPFYNAKYSFEKEGEHNCYYPWAVTDLLRKIIRGKNKSRIWESNWVVIFPPPKVLLWSEQCVLSELVHCSKGLYFTLILTFSQPEISLSIKLSKYLGCRRGKSNHFFFFFAN